MWRIPVLVKILVGLWRIDSIIANIQLTQKAVTD